MLKNIIVIDDFYSNPDEVRTLALSQDFNVLGNYPGARTKNFPENTQHIAKYIGEIMGMEVDMKNWRKGEYIGCYQYATEGDTTWIHADINSDFSCLVFLHPDPADNSGTSIYKHKDTNSIIYSDNDGEHLQSDGSSWDKWIKTDTIGNRYNRAVIFKGEMWHAADDYFGKDQYDGRLFQTFFFNEKK